MDSPTTFVQKSPEPQASLKDKNYDIVIVGGGPVGLACAFSLATLGFSNIAVLESKQDHTTMEWARSYCYRIDGHGNKWLEEVGVMEEFRQVSCKTPDIFVPLQPDGTKGSIPSIMKDVHQESRWLWRADLLQFLAGLLHARAPGRVALHFGVRCAALDRELNPLDGTFSLALRVHDAVDGDLVLHPRFVLGADGVHSEVRRSLERRDPKFAPHHIPHLTSGLPFKSLKLLVNPELAPTGTFLLLRGRNKESFGVFPQRDDRPRLVGCVRVPQHPMWKLSTPDALYGYLQSNWPQVDWKTTLPEDGASAFIHSAPVTFPPVTYSTEFHATWPAAPHPEHGANCGVALLGDAIHCFPPDLGQGVNSSLEDVFVFHQCLREAKDLASALPLYAARRQADVAALAHLFPIGAPYQYNLPFSLHKLFWHMGFVLRLLSHKVVPSVFDEPVAFGLQDPRNSYAALLAGHHRTTRRLQATGVMVALGLFAATRCLGRPAALVGLLALGAGAALVVVKALFQRPDLGKGKAKE